MNEFTTHHKPRLNMAEIELMRRDVAMQNDPRPGYFWNKKCLCWSLIFVQPRPQIEYPPYNGPYNSRMQEWSYNRRNGIQASPDDDEEQDEATGEEIKPILRPNKEGINQAHRNWVDKVAGAEGILYQLIFDCAERKLQYALRESHECAQDYQDYAQQLTIKVWQKLGTFKGESEGFYKWLTAVCENKGWDAVKANDREFEGRLPLLVVNEDGERDINPEWYKPSELRPIPTRKLPDWIQGDDLHICRLIRSDCGYKEIARVLEISEGAVKMRVAAMRTRIEAAKTQAPPA